MALSALDQRQTSRSLSVNWATKYVGIPFIKRGFDESGCHCWGLVVLVFRRELGIELPTYGEISATDLMMLASGYQVEHTWSEVKASLCAFDVVPMTDARTRRLNAHAGVMSSPSHILHVEPGIGAVNMPIDHMMLRDRVIFGAYRHRLAP